MRRARDRQIEQLEQLSEKRGATLAEDLDILLGDLCRLYGFCNHLSGNDLMSRGPTLSAADFATAVLVAEGFPDPDDEWTWKTRFQKLFTLLYGVTISASEYQQRVAR